MPQPKQKPVNEERDAWSEDDFENASYEQLIGYYGHLIGNIAFLKKTIDDNKNLDQGMLSEMIRKAEEQLERTIVWAEKKKDQ